MRLICLTLALTVVASLGCSPTTSSDDATTATPVVNVSETALAKLAEADKLDGSEDKVIHHCYSCALGMEGSDENTVSVGPYTAHFCSEACVDHFLTDPEKNITDTEIPGSSEEAETTETASEQDSQ